MSSYNFESMFTYLQSLGSHNPEGRKVDTIVSHFSEEENESQGAKCSVRVTQLVHGSLLTGSPSAS